MPLFEFLFNDAAGLPLLYPLAEDLWFSEIFSEYRNGRSATLLKRDIQCEILEIFRNTYFEKHLQRATAEIISARVS